MVEGKTKGKNKNKKLEKFKGELKKIIDPHTGISIIDMKMVKNIKVEKEVISLDFVPTSPFCPIVGHFIEAMKAAAKETGFKDCKVNVKV